MTVEQVIEALNMSWNQNHEARVQCWNQQVIEDANAKKRRQRQVAEQEAQQQNPEPRNNDPKDGEKKKPKMNDFDDAAVVDSYIAP